MSISIKGIDKARLLAELYNNSGSLGNGWIHAKAGDMTIEQARDILADMASPVFEYLNGRPLKVDLSGDWLETIYYDHWNKDPGAGERIVKGLR